MRTAPEDDFSIEGPFAKDLPAGPENLVLQARDAMRQVFGERACPPVAISLDKQLPVASGIGGGSSDAAASLRVLSRHWQTKGSRALMQSMALALGADVPMCLAARPVLASGIGEKLEPVASMPALNLVLVNPGAALATREVFGVLAGRDSMPLPVLPSRLDAENLAGWLAATRNDLEAAAATLAPGIADALSALRGEGASIVRMSGSGATCFGLFATRAAADAAARSIAAARPAWFSVATGCPVKETGK